VAQGHGAPQRASRSTIRLAFAPSSACPHCGRTTKTVQGVCADCWGSKGGRQFWVRRYQGSDSYLEEFLGVDTLTLVGLGAVVGAVPAVIVLITWIWD
jgi:hypothetical protein